MKSSKKVEFLDVEGIPVTLGSVPGFPGFCAAWDKSSPRPFPADSALRNGAPVDKAEFERLRTAANASS